MLTAPKKFLYLHQYVTGIVWMLIDSVGSQGLVILYHFFLRSYAGQEVHGAIGCFLSLTYLCTALANLGLDKALAPFLEIFILSKKRFQLFLVSVLLPQLLFLICISLLFFFNALFFTNTIPVLHSLEPYLSSSLIKILLTTFVFEGIRKTLRTFLQLSFYFRATAFIELFGIFGNLCALGFLFFAQALSVESALLAHMYMGIGQVVLLSVVIGSFYRSLQEKSTEVLSVPHLLFRITKTRLYSWVLHSLSQLYSGNFLVPICALKFGLPSASLLKVITSIAYWITLLSRNVFGTTSNAILAHLKSRSPETQKEAFHYLTSFANQALYCLLIFLLINGKKILLGQIAAQTTITWSILYFMLLINFFEGFYVLYEKWYILEEDAFVYLFFNILSMGALYLCVSPLVSPVAILSTILGIRIITLLALLGFSFHRWQIWPALRPRATWILNALVLSGIYYLLF